LPDAANANSAVGKCVPSASAQIGRKKA